MKNQNKEENTNFKEICNAQNSHSQCCNFHRVSTTHEAFALLFTKNTSCHATVEAV